MYIALDDWRRWAPDLATWLEERFDTEVLEQFDSNVEHDWLDWLDLRQAQIDGNHLDSVALFEQVVRGRYAGVKVIHATRLVSLDSVREHGLRAWSEQELTEQALERFSGAADGRRLGIAIEHCNPRHRGGRVYSFASLQHALGTPHEDRSGKVPSFALHGGEFLAAVAMRSGIEEQLPGHGYLLACNLPWAWLDRDQITTLTKDILLSAITTRFFNPGDYRMVGSHECISTTRDIPPRHIELVANIEDLRDRDDLTAEDIPWLLFQL
ncbi:hypothetical protein [Pseudoxanthomonas sp. X-1]|uniref:hypothetical protein n=1 Tax=Pseudoxanthomonas sp. X-1 TaxID=2571115 RepID=UPI00110BD57B|nr:hypothetical protein [Pseudoxanthomonas sp. X-1]TMN24161.1 hypothetical protein FF950_06475 [Pseudoxanthomonas sp. X-1]UAY75126.1 hypothetical protein LAJ50_02345 [Pseudoxanthomonas sp. X-1]